MSIVIKSARDIALMRQAGRIAAGARTIARQMIAPGVTTKAINKEVFNYIRKSGAEPTFLGYGGYPASACISVNDQVIHGIPGSRKLQEGDIVKSVNSLLMTNRRRAEDMIASFATGAGSLFVLEIERDGKTFKQLYEFEDNTATEPPAP